MTSPQSRFEAERGENGLTRRWRKRAAFRSWGIVDDAKEVKIAVEVWAESLGFFCLPEIGVVTGGRVDVLMVPLSMDTPIYKRMKQGCHWTERLGLVGVEIKVTGQDFKQGLENGQFERYEADLCGLYVAGPPFAFKESDVPRRYGVLHVRDEENGKHERTPTTICRRHPQFQPVIPTTEQMWRIVWAIQKRQTEARKEARESAAEFEKRIGYRVGHALARTIANLRQEVLSL